MTRVDESGGEARTYIVDEAIVLKVQRPQQVRVGTSLAREVFFLNQLAAAAPAECEDWRTARGCISGRMPTNL
jgi:hypothetical protein